MLRVRRTFLILLAVTVLAWLTAFGCHINMPGHSFRGELPAMTDTQLQLARELERDVTVLATEIGARHTGAPEKLDAARDFIGRELERAGYAARYERWTADGVECSNVIAELAGSNEIVVVGAHYDSVADCPAANDNGSGVAGLLAIARRLARSKPVRTLRFVAFANEEPPYFGTGEMGSAYHARGCRERAENIVVMLSLETIGFYTDEPDSQDYPSPAFAALFPTTGNFLAFVGDLESKPQVRESVRIFRETTPFPCEGVSLPRAVPGAGWSDQLSFWNEGYRALMATDTAPFRYPHYHTPQDTPDKLDYPRTARVVEGLQRVIEHWSNPR